MATRMAATPTLLDDLKDWTDADAAALALGRSLGVFAADTSLVDAKAVLWTNDAAGNTLYGMLERLAWLGVLERDDEQQRYRAAIPNLHALSDNADVPALESGPPKRCNIRLSLDAPEGFRLEADRPGFRYLGRVFDEIAGSGVESGWTTRRDEHFGPAAETAAFSFTLIDPDSDEPEPDAPP
jgi:hypothetical protein